MSKTTLDTLPATHQRDLEQAIIILKAAGCSKVFLFGSAASGEADATSDLDLAIRGCPEGQFFRLLSVLYMELDTVVDLIDLDNEKDPFVMRLATSQELIPLA